MGAESVKVDVQICEADEPTFLDVFSLLLQLHAAGGYAELNVDKASDNCFRVMETGLCLLARVAGRPVGTLALAEVRFWYADTAFLQDAWFFVLPEFRGQRVGIDLLKAAKDVADERQQILFVTVNNPDRRPKRTTMSLESQIAGYVPLGYTLKLR